MGKLFVQKDPNVADLEGEGGRTPFITAFENRHWNILEYLISLSNVKIDVADLKGYRGKSPLVSAARNGDLEVVKYLISQQNVSINSQDDDSVPADFQLLSIINQKFGNQNGTLTLKIGHLDIVEYLISQQNVDIYSRDDDGLTIVGQTALIAAARGGHLDIVEYLTSQQNVNIDMHDKHGATALFEAVINNHPKVVQLLIEKGADGSIKFYGKTVLEWAKIMEYTDVIKVMNTELELNTEKRNTKHGLETEHTFTLQTLDLSDVDYIEYFDSNNTRTHTVMFNESEYYT